MKFLLTLVGILVAGAFGYLLEPTVRYSLTGLHPGDADETSFILVRFDQDGNSTRMRMNIADLKPEQLPARVMIERSIQVADAATGVTMEIEAGSNVRPLRIEKGELVVSPGAGGFEGRVPVSQTDLLHQLSSGPKPPEPQPDALAVRTDSPDSSGGMTGGAMVGDLAPTPPPMEPEPEPEPEPERDPEPGPEPEPEEEEDTGPVDVVKTMQESIKAAEIQEFTFDQVSEWSESENETIDGTEYQIGLATYQKETFLGPQSIQAKALIRGGKVQRWVTAKSGFDIK